MNDGLDRIAEFIYANSQGFSHLVDLPYRLSSWSLENPDNLRLWESEGQIQAIGMVQQPWLALDYAYRPGQEGLVPQIFDWASERAQAIARETGEDFTLVIRFPPRCADHIPLAQSRGFALDDDWTIVHLSRALSAPLPVPALPDGFSFRTLRDHGDVEAYVKLHQTAFGSKNMQERWRSRTLTMPQYRPDLDLFIINEHDQPVAFCIGWKHPTKPLGQIEPLGVHPDYQRLGLGRAVLLEGLRRLEASGARTAYIDSYKYNDPALSLYQTANNGNFQPTYEATGYTRVFTNHETS
jgi:mycothiol synthase